MNLAARTITLKSVWTLLGLLVALTAVVAGAFLGLVFAWDMGLDQALTVLAWLVLAHGALMFATTHLWARRCGLRWSSFGFVRPTKRIWHLLWQIPVVLFAAVVTNVVFFSLVGGADEAAAGDVAIEELARDVSTLAAVAIFLGVVVAAPLWEEAVFRGVLYSALRERMALEWVCLITAAMFAVVHLTPLLMPYLFVMGIALALLRAFHGNLWAPLIMHATVNFLASITVLLVILDA